MLSKTSANYITQFLCNDSDAYISKIGYCNEDDIPKNKKIIIVQSDFFKDGVYGTEKTLPALPLKEWEGIPLLFGEGRTEERDGQIILYADIIASSYFLITRYEEMVRPTVRDVHGRFPGKESLPARGGFLDRPVVDEYGRQFRNLLRQVGISIPEPQEGFHKIWLTHDIDVPWEPFTSFGAVKRVLGNWKRTQSLNLYPIKNWMGHPEQDPQYTFKKMIQMDALVPQAKSVYFMKSGGTKKPEDGDIYIRTEACRRLLRDLTNSHAILGYHVSYQAGIHSEQVESELKLLRHVVGHNIHYSRNHYLASREPSDFHALIQAGITDDFTMGYADIAGFRLGTSHAVRWIDPAHKELTGLTLHPLTMMECSLLAEGYMNLEDRNAQQYAEVLLFATRKMGGELTLLWHNTAFMPEMRELKLYEHLIVLLTHSDNKGVSL